MGWEYKCPQGCVYPIRSVAIRDSHVAQEISRLLRHRLPSSITSIGVRLREETTDPTEATFRYTHGIQNHDGLCQRIFHGHRSKVEVYCGDERRPDLEHYIVRTLLNSSVHIATPSQIKSGNFEIGKLGTAQEQVSLSFQGSKGTYQAKVPGNKLFAVEQETSIECITMHLAKALKNKDPNITKKIKVVCYEGIDKGAIAIL